MDVSDQVPGRTLAKIGAWLQLGPVFGMIGTAVGMVRAFSTLTTSQSGDPALLSGAIGEVLISTAIGIAFAAIGFFFLLTAVTVYRFRPRWAKVMLVVASLPIAGLATQAIAHALSPRTVDSSQAELTD